MEGSLSPGSPSLSSADMGEPGIPLDSHVKESRIQDLELCCNAFDEVWSAMPFYQYSTLKKAKLQTLFMFIRRHHLHLVLRNAEA